MLSLTKNNEDAKCPVCSTPIGSDHIECEQCLTPHHSDCWAYIGGCAVFACGKAIEQKNTLTDEETQKLRADTERWIKWHICYVWSFFVLSIALLLLFPSLMARSVFESVGWPLLRILFAFPTALSLVGLFVGLPTLVAGLFFTRCFRTVVDDNTGLVGAATEAPKSLVIKMNILEKLSLSQLQLDRLRSYGYTFFWLFFLAFYLLVKTTVTADKLHHLLFFQLLGHYLLSFILSFVFYEVGIHKVRYLSCLNNRFSATFKE
mgnify:CR=1 FL=1